jgi:predicted aldo/keto reductase-like oxidoreductase
VEYRSFGKLDWKASALGFGTMRLPTIANDQAKVNEAETIKLIRLAIDQGVNYIDSAFTYHDGNSEAAIGKALQGKYRQKTKIATKMPVYQVQTKDDLDRILGLQMKRLKTNYIDFYLFHSLNKKLWQKVKDLDMIGWAERQVAKGRLGYLGFSFHDELDVFKEIVDSYDNWTMSQIQYNYLNEKYQAGKAGLKYAASKGLAVVIMEPLAGGMLAVNPPAQIQSELAKAPFQRTPADWALQWIWSQPEVSLALSGMNTMQQVTDNVESACKSAPNSLDAKEIRLLQRAGQLYGKCGYVGCTKCRYCSHCPQNIDIPTALAFLNQYSTMPKTPKTEANIKLEYAQAVPQVRRASDCIRCGQCETVCPQHLPVRKLLSEAAGHLE